MIWGQSLFLSTIYFCEMKLGGYLLCTHLHAFMYFACWWEENLDGRQKSIELLIKYKLMANHLIFTIVANVFIRWTILNLWERMAEYVPLNSKDYFSHSQLVLPEFVLPGLIADYDQNQILLCRYHFIWWCFTFCMTQLYIFYWPECSLILKYIPSLSLFFCWYRCWNPSGRNVFL